MVPTFGNVDKVYCAVYNRPHSTFSDNLVEWVRMMGKRVDSPDAEHSFERFVNSRPASDDDLLTSRQAGDSSPNTEGGVGTWAKDNAHLSMNDAIIMKKPLLVALTLSVFALVGQAAVNVPLTIQEAIYPGSIAGISRTADPV